MRYVSTTKENYPQISQMTQINTGKPSNHG